MKRRIGVLLIAGVACATAAPPPSAMPVAPVTPSEPASVDSGAGDLIPAGYGTRRRDEITIKLQPENVLVNLVPVDESVIRVLAADSYRSLHSQVESRRPELARVIRTLGLRRGSIWYAEFIGLAPDARYIPTDVTITSGGRDFRPLHLMALTSGLGSQRLQPRETQQALYVFDDAVDVGQSLTVTMGTQRNTDWETILRNVIERERTQIRARAAGKPPT